MKTIDLTNTLAGCTGRIMLYCYRLYVRVFKQTVAYKPMETAPAKKHIQFTSRQFKTPCYN